MTLRKPHYPEAATGIGTGVTNCPDFKKLSRFRSVSSSIAARVSTVPLATCGSTTTLSIVSSAPGTFGSSSNTSSPAPGTDIVYLATRESKQYTRASNRVGRRLPAHTTALGKALLAERFGTDRDEHIPAGLKQLTPNTIVDRPALDDVLDEVRVRGYATDDQENTMGLRCYAVALRYCQPAQDAISASVPVGRLTPRREREIVDALCAMGDKVSRVVRPLANGDKWCAS